MSDQARTLLSQARAARQNGQHQKSINLLRRARLLAGENAELLIVVLTELITTAPLAGLTSELADWQRQLASIRPQPKPGVGDDQLPITRHSKNKLGQLLNRAAFASCVVISIGLLVFGVHWFWHYSESRYSISPRGGVATSAPGTASSSTPTGDIVRPARTTVIKEHSASQPADSLREQRLSNHIGLLLWVQQYTFDRNGRDVAVEYPVATGTAFAVAHAGIMLTNAHVLHDVRIPETIDGGRRAGPAILRVCFGVDPTNHYVATIEHISARFDLAVISIDRQFLNPLRLSGQPAVKQENVVAYGFPGSVLDIDRAANSRVIQNRINLADMTGHLSYRDWFPPDTFDSVATAGIISSPNRNMSSVHYHLFDARVSGGNSGGPLIRVSSDEVVGIVTMGGVDLEHKDNNYALALPQLMEELQPWISPEKLATEP